MTLQLNLRVSEEFLKRAKNYAKINGFLNVQELFREATREKIFEKDLVKRNYLKRLNSKEAKTFLSEKESEIFEKELEKRTNLK